MNDKVSTTELRRRNRNRVFRCFYDSPDTPKTKQDLAAALALSLPTITQNLRELTDAGLIDYAGVIESTGGRRARTMALLPGAHLAVGAELSAGHVRLVATDLRAKELAYRRIDLPFDNSAAYGEQLADALEAFLTDFSLDRTRLLGVGLALPGVIDVGRGLIEIAPVLRIRRMRLSLLTAHIPYPTFVVNDATAGGFAEWWNRADARTMAYLSLGRGVGGSLLVAGHPYSGEHGRSAEFGHMTIVPDGAPCECGQHGCLEAYCSAARLSDDVHLPLPDFFARVRARDTACFSRLQTYLDHLSIGIHSMRMALDCDIVLGGAVAPHLGDYLPDLRARLSARDSFGGDGSYIQVGHCGDKAAAIGAALHFVGRFIANI